MNRHIEFQTISHGNTTKIPVWDKIGQSPGKTIVITAGMDGDEYAGIEAAYKLVTFFSNEIFAGRIIIIPLVNTWGFESGVSFNPIDNKFPKHIFPGTKNGTDSEQLLYSISEKYINTADIWIDLHGGALTEKLVPFIWTWETKNKDIDSLTEKLLSSVSSPIKIFDKRRSNKVQELAKKNIAYILLESGCLGERNEQDINRHVRWVKEILHSIYQKTPFKFKDAYTMVQYYLAPCNGLWYPEILEKRIVKGKELGHIFSFTGKKIKSFASAKEGTLLWYRTSLNAKKGEIVAAIAVRKEK